MMNSRDLQKKMKRTRQSAVLCLLLAAPFTAPVLAHAQYNQPLTGEMLQAQPGVTTVNTPGVAPVVAPAVRQAPAAVPAVVPAAASVEAAAPAVASAGPVAQVSAREAGPRLPTGEATRRALAMQRSGSHAGPALPMLGATALPAWNRYIDSFSYDMSEFYESDQ